MAARLEFRIDGLASKHRVATVTPWIDGKSLVELVRHYEKRKRYDVPGKYDGIVPAQHQFGPLDDHFLGRGPTAERVQVLGCNCGEAGCWPLMARVSVVQDSVMWDDFEQPYRPDRDYARFGPFVFDRASYEESCRAIGTAKFD